MWRTGTALLLTLAVACGGSGTEPMPADQPIPGTYDLKTVGGAPLPSALSITSTRRDSLTGETLTLDANGNVGRSSQITTTYTPGGVVYNQESSTGTFSQSAGAISLTDIYRGALTGTVAGGQIRLNRSSAWVYVRRP